MEINIRHITGGKIWHKKGNMYHYHREDGPARIWEDGKEDWYYDRIYYNRPEEMPLNLFLAYCKWEYRKIHGS